MLQEAEAKQLLEEAFEAEMLLLEENFAVYRGSVGRSLKSYSKSKLTSLSRSVKTDGNLYSAAWEKMQSVVGICVLNEENSMVWVFGSGWMKMNPAIVELHFRDTQMEITAWAKEGILKQRTAEKAIQMCLTALKLNR